MNHKIDHPVPPSLVAQIGALYHRLYKESDKLFREHDFPLQMDQVPVLMVLYYAGGASQKDVGTALGRDKASINRTISVLLKKDFVKVIPDAVDKRKTHVELTASGQKLAKQADAILGRFDAVLSSELTLEERKGLDKTMLKLIGLVTPC
ncbi:MarR family winged helix-turn-helix transcriptional regulator [Mucilaginibacter dorajii]|uniref:HTH marR-type domain-containing protein n=1 Tax=Mucilaginibacter dorajii TaxID=692994 RepID=A0ABP7QSU3_9SPHI|nr:MarR family transcriptional regulator [Mucilaginibacter dorajii]MCS3734029.1 DNA-binding MarR family transcriptional regulator [Mucilaginibacter dorajii]